MNRRLSLSCLFSCSVLLSGCTPVEPVESPSPAGAELPVSVTATPEPKNLGVSFTKSIQPILSNKCTICHNSRVLPTRPNFETREGAMDSGMIVPGKPEASRILAVVEKDPHAEKAMPPVNHRLTKDEIGLLRRWISEGAEWPGGEAGRVKPAFLPKE